MYAVQRTHALRRDRDWLPASVRRIGWAVSGAVWGTAGAAGVAALMTAPGALILLKHIALGGVGVAVAGQRAGRYAFRRKLDKLTRGEVPLGELKSQTEGELVCVRGKIEATASLTGLLHGTQGVYRRLVFKAGRAWVHEAAVDFSLVDPSGYRIHIQAAGARWLTLPREWIDYPASQLLGDHVPQTVRERVQYAGASLIPAYERVLQLGADVQVVGYKTASPDVTGDMADYRSPPQRATLRSGDDLPLVITTNEER